MQNFLTFINQSVIMMRATTIIYLQLLLLLLIAIVECQLLWPKQFVTRMVAKHHHRLRRPQNCYENLGCFLSKDSALLHHHAPETPEMLETKFYLFYNESMLHLPHVLEGFLPTILYDDFQNGAQSQQLKVLIHGFMGTWNGRRAFDGIKAYLKFPNYKVLSVDWQIGARGPKYANAVANTEVIGRQLGYLLFEMITKWYLDAQNVHLIGFSLGAHIAGCASEFLKNRGILIGRITGLDPAGPLFNHNLIKQFTKKLDKSDARYVDIIHSDASLIFTNGFGIVHSVGHVDFFPNGGRSQPGCPDKKTGSRSVSGLTEDKACSHIRAWDLFYESIVMQLRNDTCEFVAFKCSGGYDSFKTGNCFPAAQQDTFENGKMGDVASGYGPQYLITRSKEPYCGHQVRLTLFFNEFSTELMSHLVKGRFVFTLNLNENLVQIRIRLISEESPMTKQIHGLVALRHGLLTNISTIDTTYRFESQTQNHSTNDMLIRIDKVLLEDLYGNRWTSNDTIYALADDQITQLIN